MIPIHEIHHTIEGESSHTGFDCIVVRTYGCNLNCLWCDTLQNGIKPTNMTIEDIVQKVKQRAFPHHVLLTGGEPLIHDETPQLCRQLLDENFKVLIETNGSLDISTLPDGVIKILDIKTPSSGCSEKNLFSNIEFLSSSDEVKFVIASRHDYNWAKKVIEENLSRFKGVINISPLLEGNLPAELCRWILNDRLKVRFNLQIHKIIFKEGFSDGVRIW